MSPTSRNSLMIGSALIAIALLFTFGALDGWLGGANGSGAPLPAVTAGPKASSAGPLGSAVVGAAAGAQLGQPEVAAAAVAEPADDVVVGGGALSGASVGAAGAATGVGGGGVVVAGLGGAGVAGGAVAAGTTGGGGAGGAGAEAAASTPVASAPVAAAFLPPVSAGGPVTMVAASIPAPVLLAAAATGAFDRAFGGPDESTAGPVVARFAPPVAAVGGSPMALAAAAQPFGTQLDGIRQACDSPGAGCRNVMGVGPNPMPNPPILVPGQRPQRMPNNP